MFCFAQSAAFVEAITKCVVHSVLNVTASLHLYRFFIYHFSFWWQLVFCQVSDLSADSDVAFQQAYECLLFLPVSFFFL